MISYPNAKINLGLNVHKKRLDGYHELQSFFMPIPLVDILEIVPNTKSKQTNFTSSGIYIDGNKNICEQAYDLIKSDFDIPSVQIHLHKQIPIGAGLGGGSADASFTLKMLNEMFNLNISTYQLESYAKQLGADCPFFIDNQPKFVEGIGEIMIPTDTSALQGKYLVLIFPDIHISTKEAYKGIAIQAKSELKNFNFNNLK